MIKHRHECGGISVPIETVNEIVARLKENKRLKQEQLAVRRIKSEDEKTRLRQDYLKKFNSCPFDGGKNLGVELNGMKTDWVRCYDCHCTGPVADGEEDAIKKWNSRIKQTKASA